MKKLVKVIASVAVGAALVCSAAVAQEAEQKKSGYQHEMPEGGPVQFHEVWGYVMEEREYQFKNTMPVTDLCYFSADVNSYGELNHIPDPNKFSGYKGRKHLVITCQSRSLTHFVLDPKYDVRKGVLDKIEQASKIYDGIQIDFEVIPARDAGNFRSFLKDIRTRIGEEKWLTVALPARIKTLKDDIYDYQKIAPLVDRIIIMAYDEHWSGSKPGSVASMDWCEKIVDYCQEVLPAKKIVMGLPFYGRSWQSDSYGTAWIYNSVNRIINENEVQTIERDKGVPYFKFSTDVNVTCYFEDTYSLVTRCRLYENKGVRRIAFWRIGQEDADFWPWLKLN